MTSVFRMVGALLVLVAFVAGCTSATGKSAGHNIDDATITASVKTKQGKPSTPYFEARATPSPFSASIRKRTNPSLQAFKTSASVRETPWSRCSTTAPMRS